MSKEEYLDYLYSKQAEKQADVEKLDKEYRNLWRRYNDAPADSKDDFKPLMWNKYHELVDAKAELANIDDEINKTKAEQYLKLIKDEIGFDNTITINGFEIIFLGKHVITIFCPSNCTICNRLCGMISIKIISDHHEDFGLILWI